MILILHASRHQNEARVLEAELHGAYNGRLHVELRNAEDIAVWPGDASWDDLLVVLFDATSFEETTTNFLNGELASKLVHRTIIPLAIFPELAPAPPPPLKHLKALPWNATAAGTDGRLARRVGAVLGLRVRSRDNSIFISYRSLDGKSFAEQIQVYLGGHGYQTWRDEARDQYDSETSIPAGDDVQTVIEENLKKADLLLLLDTPQASASRWIKFEVDLANGNLEPVINFGGCKLAGEPQSLSD